MAIKFYFCELGQALMVILLVFSADLSNAETIELTPNGVDDTAQLQAALNTCSGATSNCKIILSEGIFYSDVLLVFNFNGRITGQGANATIIRPVSDRPLRSTDIVFQNDPTLDEPYAVFLHFSNGGNIELLDFTLDFSANMEVEPFVTFGSPDDSIEDALLSGIMADGTTTAVHLFISGVEILGSANDELTPFGSNLMNAIRFEGQFRGGAMTPLSSGSFTAKSTRIFGGGLGFALRDVNNVEVKIMNSISHFNRLISVFLTDMADSKVKVMNNDLDSELEAIQIVRGFRDPAPESASKFLIANNIVSISGRSLFGPGDAIVYGDLTPEAGISDVVIKNNFISLETDAFEGVYVYGDQQKTKIERNEISGTPIYAGITIDGSLGTRTHNNNFENLQPQLADVWLTNTTSYCSIKEPGASVVDEGTNNDVQN